MKSKERIKQLEDRVKDLEIQLELIQNSYQDALHDRNVVELIKANNTGSPTMPPQRQIWC